MQLLHFDLQNGTRDEVSIQLGLIHVDEEAGWVDICGMINGVLRLIVQCP